jgi:O-acetyl-ADP-ribose deacetylase (regulator of RNase III)
VIRKPVRWTNASVLGFAGQDDPVEKVIDRARAVVADALDAGWSGPPFDPIRLADYLRLEVSPRADVADARTVPIETDHIRIEFNPNRPRGRMRYSLAHEIAHTLFPDCAERVRHRGLTHGAPGDDDWQLEALCNVAAAEMLMPFGTMPTLRAADLGVDRLLQLQRQYDVSTEALFIRVAETSEEPCAAFCASTRVSGTQSTPHYSFDYAIGSSSWPLAGRRAVGAEAPSVVAECKAIGYTAKGETTLGSSGRWRIEAVGIPGYPGAVIPRVVGILAPLESAEPSKMSRRIGYVAGSALEPRGTGPHLIVQVVNDETANWGGGGFAVAVRKAHPEVQDDFRDWASHAKDGLRLGNIRISRVDKNTSVANVIAQKGYGPSARPRIRYAALRAGLERVAEVALERGCSVHMPRIGTGQAGGSWEMIEELVRAAFLNRGVPVTVYDLPGATPRLSAQQTLPFSATP